MIDCRLDTEIGDEGAKSIASALEMNKAVMYLDLSCKWFLIITWSIE